MQEQLLPNLPNGISIAKAYGEWQVAVREDDKLDVRTFQTERYAQSYAEGQKFRLGLDKIDRV